MNKFKLINNRKITQNRFLGHIEQWEKKFCDEVFYEKITLEKIQSIKNICHRTFPQFPLQIDQVTTYDKPFRHCIVELDYWHEGVEKVINEKNFSHLTEPLLFIDRSRFGSMVLLGRIKSEENEIELRDTLLVDPLKEQWYNKQGYLIFKDGILKMKMIEPFVWEHQSPESPEFDTYE